MLIERPPYENFEVGTYPTREQFDRFELKYDGWYTSLIVNGTNCDVFSRTGRQLDPVPVLTHPSRPRAVLIAEYIRGTEWATDHPEFFERFAVHSAIEIDGEDITKLRSADARTRLEEYVHYLKNDRFFVAEQWPIEMAPQIWQSKVVDDKYEGLVFKHTDKRWNDGFGRMKNVATMDYVCMGFIASTADSYAGTGVACVVGGLYVGGTLVQVCKVSGINDDQRYEFYQHPERYIGRVFEVAGKKISKRGAMRHPEFIRWRDDKKAEDCKWPVK